MAQVTYTEYKAQEQEAFNALPIFYAFSNDQFEKAMQERGLTINDTDKIYKLGGTGGFYLKKDAPVIREYFNRPNKLAELMQDEEFAEEAFLYEMNNHEYAINWEGDYDVCNCFAPRTLEYGEDKSYTDYLKEAGLAGAITAYRRAKARHMKAAEEWA